MKHFIFLFCFFVSAVSINAQDVISKMADGTCACLQKNEVAKKKDNLEIELGLCMVEQVGLYRKELQKAGYKTDAPDFYEKLGEELGVKLVLVCPYFISLVSDMMADEDSDLRERVESRMEERSKAPETQYMTGKVQTVEYGDFVKFSITDDNNRRKEVYWINAFDGDDQIMLLASLDALIGKTVSIQYVEEEVYFHKLKSYLGIKKLTSLNIQ